MRAGELEGVDEVKDYEDDRQALVVYAVYKSKMTCQFDAGTECEVGPIGLNATRVSSAVKELF